MNAIRARLDTVNRRIRDAAARCGRPAGAVQLLAVSKTRPPEDIRAALAAGQLRFGESYLQEALEKIRALRASQAQWHFIGRIQGNKTRAIAEHFDWVHSLCSIRHAQRLNDQRPDELPPLNLCLQINLSGEDTKAGIAPEEAFELVARLRELPRLNLCGLMTLPAPAETLEQQRLPFRRLRELRDRLATPALPLATLSMGMSGDLEAAIAEGATIVRIGTAIFGPRTKVSSR
ncbi:MAG TPA: YggS family pyridoxal phosphate-dependent enzyme [Sedimenticola sp.]|nr:YggS family pyridoxal phosphate-dependent enzyme [Sedimenticola sp.]